MPSLFSKILNKGQRGSSSGDGSDGAGSQPAINAVYYPNWAVYYPLPPSSLDLSSITHILYAFVWPNADGTIAYSDSYADHDVAVDGTTGGLRAINRIKRGAGQHVKVLLSVGGGGKGSEGFSIMARNPAARAHFAQSLQRLVTTYGFDGIDIDWEHPANSDEKAGYLALVRQLRQTFPRPFLLTSALPAPASLLQHVPLAKAMEELDHLFLMAYDFTGPWTETSGHHAQLFGSPISGADAVSYLKSKGVPLRKIVLGVPVYGRFFPGAGSVDRPYTKPKSEEAATLEYYKLPPKNSMKWVDDASVAAYSVGSDGFTSYDDVTTVSRKAAWAKEQGLAGLFYWTVLGDKRDDESLIRAGWNALQ